MQNIEIRQRILKSIESITENIHYSTKQKLFFALQEINTYKSPDISGILYIAVKNDVV